MSELKLWVVRHRLEHEALIAAASEEEAVRRFMEDEAQQLADDPDWFEHVGTDVVEAKEHYVVAPDGGFASGEFNEDGIVDLDDGSSK